MAAHGLRYTTNVLSVQHMMPYRRTMPTRVIKCDVPQVDYHVDTGKFYVGMRGMSVWVRLQQCCCNAADAYRCNEELLELLLLEGEGDVPDAEASSGHTKVGAAQLGVLLLSSPLALASICCRHGGPGGRPLLYCALLGLHPTQPTCALALATSTMMTLQHRKRYANMNPCMPHFGILQS